MLQKNGLVIANNSSEAMLIDARLLHQQLQIKSIFANWIQRRIEEFGFEANKDFFPILEKTNRYGRNRNEYHLTFDMAKELAMLERNEIGKNVRRYFIAVEKEARATAGSPKLLPKGIRYRILNGRKLYPYRKLAFKLGYTSSGSLAARKNRYPNHFVKIDGLNYTSEEMANMMLFSRKVYEYRKTIKVMQPLLPLDFGGPIKKIGGKS